MISSHLGVNVNQLKSYKDVGADGKDNYNIKFGKLKSVIELWLKYNMSIAGLILSSGD